MNRSTYGERDYAFGEVILMLRTSIGLTQAGLADLLHVSRRAVGEWEAGSSYPNVDHLIPTPSFFTPVIIWLAYLLINYNARDLLIDRRERIRWCPTLVLGARTVADSARISRPCGTRAAPRMKSICPSPR